MQKRQGTRIVAMGALLGAFFFLLFAGIPTGYASNLTSSFAIGNYIHFTPSSDEFDLNFVNFGMPSQSAAPT